jgi:biotin carboxylase
VLAFYSVCSIIDYKETIKQGFERGEQMAGENDRIIETRLVTDIPQKLKRRLKFFCAREDVKIKEVTAAALEFYLDEYDGIKKV